MAMKKYLSLDRLTEYDALLKAEITEADEEILTSAKTHADNNLAAAQLYADNAVAQKSQVQIITWEADD